MKNVRDELAQIEDAIEVYEVSLAVSNDPDEVDDLNHQLDELWELHDKFEACMVENHEWETIRKEMDWFVIRCKTCGVEDRA